MEYSLYMNPSSDAHIPVAMFVSWARLAIFMQQNKGPDRRFASDAPKMRGTGQPATSEELSSQGKESLKSPQTI